MRTRLSPAAILPPAFLGIGSFVIYVTTLCPTIYVGDSAEFITNAATLGINHPTGYPLYTLLGRILVLLLPFAAPAMAVNLLSAAASAGAVVCVFYIMSELTSERIVASATALLFAFSQTLWARSTTAEVYTLNAFFVALSLLLVLRWNSTGDVRPLLLAAYASGVGLNQHVTGVITAVILAFFVLLTKPRIVRDLPLLLSLAALVLLGSSTYLYLPVRSIAQPPLDWGNAGFFEKLTSHIYPVGPKGITAFFGEEQGGRSSWVISQLFAREFWYFGVLAIVGAVLLIRQWRVLALLVALIAGNLWFSLSRKLPLHADFDAYLLPTVIVFVILIGVTLSSGASSLKSLIERRGDTRMATKPALLFFILPGICLLTHWATNDKSTNTFGHDFSSNLLAPLSPGAILFTTGDEQTFDAWYAKYLDKSRKDIAVIDVRLLGTSWGAEGIFRKELVLPLGTRRSPDQLGRQIIDEFIDRRPIYFTHRLPWDFLLQDYDMVHTGMLIQLLRKGEHIDYRPSEFALDAGWTRLPLEARCRLLINFYPKEYLDNAQFWFGRSNDTAAQNELSGFFSLPFPPSQEDNVTALLLKSLLLGRARHTIAAIHCLDSVLVLDPANWRGYEFRGNFRFVEGDSARALEDWEESLSLNPSNQNVVQNIRLLRRSSHQGSRPR